jgi:uncharacterized membrane-anchored protein YhcB (DUF1043 family)
MMGEIVAFVCGLVVGAILMRILCDWADRNRERHDW